ncbi:arylsulfatase B-like [Ruditapes philippinarum]|uniref:arylsulfatase B-like n=1 Tax=Ruditapes philippinarum TaxID=129788 RepID=UPI00295B817F|nr:arylsulfatase B-like [Ruditapes philippinarum]
MQSVITISLIFLITSVHNLEGKKPNIVFIVADDLGWNDVGFHNPSMITPNIDKLAYQGVLLNHSYVQPVCSPSRHAFMTGYYPFKAGLQHLVIGHSQNVCSPLNMTFLPKHLKQAGYATHAIGKWHLGFCNWECTAEYRGFDSFYGYYNSRSDYYTHVQDKFLDFHDGYNVVWDKNGSYSADLYADRAEHIIAKHNKSQPLFLYLPYQNVHEPLEVPPEYEALYPNVETPGRRTYCGMVTALDAAIGRVVEALKQKGLYDDTIFFFTPDNGGWTPYHGNNWPLRGGKITIWEGGTRVPGFVSGSRLEKTGSVFNGLMHAVDWHPTILTAAGLSPDPSLDGISQWDAISSGSDGKRTEFIYNLDDTVPATQGHAGIRMGDFKLLAGNTGLYNGWYPPDKMYTEKALEEEFSFEERLKAGNESYYKLFNLKDDPNEYKNLADDMPEMVQKLLKRMNEYRKDMIPARIPPTDPAANPKYFGNVWSPGWCKKPMS